MFALAGVVLSYLNAVAFVGALAGAVLETVFAIACVVHHQSWVRGKNPFLST